MSSQAATLLVDSRRTTGVIDDRASGQFFEPLGRCIYGGIRDPDAPVANDQGFRTDVLDAYRQLAPLVHPRTYATTCCIKGQPVLLCDAMLQKSQTFDPAIGHPSRWQILAIMCTCLVLVVAGVSSLNIAIPSIIDDLQPTATETLWIIDAYALVFAGLLLPAGAIGDRYGRKGALLVGLGIFIAGALWSAYSNDATWLIIARGSMGIGAALVMPATLSIVISVFAPQDRAKAIAVWAGFAGGGAAIGIIGGGALLEKFWWGSVFFINVPIALLAGLMIAAMVPTSRDEHQTKLDPVGSVLSILGLGALVYAIIEGGDAGWAQGTTIGAFIAAAVLLTVWTKWEHRIPNPMLDPRLFKRRTFSLGSLSIGSGFAVMFGMFFLITQYFQFVQGHSPLSAGVRNLPFALTMVVVSPLSPKVAERVGKHGSMTIGLTLQGSGFLLLATHGTDTRYLFTALCLVTLAAGMALLMPPGSEAIVSSLPPSKAGVGSAWNDATREIGGALGIAVMGTILATGYRSGIDGATVGLPPEAAEAANEGIGAALKIAEVANAPQLIEPARQAFVDGMTSAFLIAGIFGFVIAALVFFGYPRKGHEPDQVTEAEFYATP
jgi:EmrB/QacA subfamily drug resistance transporter